jgi:hypothetical protein
LAVSREHGVGVVLGTEIVEQLEWQGRQGRGECLSLGVAESCLEGVNSQSNQVKSGVPDMSRSGSDMSGESGLKKNSDV